MTRLLKTLIICLLTAGLALGSMTAMGFDASPYNLVFGEARWQTKINNFMNAIATTVSNNYIELGNLIANWINTVDSLTLIQAAVTYSDNHTFTVPGDYSALLTAGKRLVADCAADGLKPNTVVSCTYAAPTSTVVVTTSNLTANLAAVSYYATRNGINTYGSGDVVLSEYGAPSWLNFQAAVAVANASGRRLLITPGNHPISDNINITAPWQPVPGAILTVATTKILTLSGPGPDAAPYQIFSCTGTGKVSFGAGAVKEVFPEWFAVNTTPGTTDMSAAIQSAIDATPNNGTVTFIGSAYAAKELSIDHPINLKGNNRNINAVFLTMSAAGTHLIKWAGDADGAPLVGGNVDNMNFDNQGDFAISDALVVIEGWTDQHWFRSYIGHSKGVALRLRNFWDSTFDTFFLRNNNANGGVGHIVFDSHGPSSVTYNTNNIRFTNSHFEGNIGAPYFYAKEDANLDILTVTNSKFEYNPVSADATLWYVFDLRQCVRVRISGNSFYGYTGASDKHLFSFGYAATVAAFEVHNNDFAATDATTVGLKATGRARGLFYNNTVVASSNTVPIASIDSTDVVNFEKPRNVDSAGSGGQMNYRASSSGNGMIRPQEFSIIIVTPTGPLFVTDALSKNGTGVVLKSAAAASSEVCSLPFYLFRNYPGAVRVAVRARSESGAGTLYLMANTTYIGSGAGKTIASTYTTYFYDVPADMLAIMGDSGSDRFKFATGNANAEAVYIDGIYLQPLTWSHKFQFSWNPGSLADGAGETKTVTSVTGAEVGDHVDVYPGESTQGMLITGWVSAATEVRVRIQNETTGTIDLGNTVWIVTITKKPQF